MPQQTAQLVWLGLSPRSVEILAPYVCVLPAATALNLNTAGPEVIYASLPSLDLAAAQQFVRQRANRPPLANLEMANKALGLVEAPKGLDIKSSYFFIRGRMRLDDTVQEDHLLVERNGPKISILWRERAVRHLPVTP
jgi:general secretion pathway protein K